MAGTAQSNDLDIIGQLIGQWADTTHTPAFTRNLSAAEVVELVRLHCDCDDVSQLSIELSNNSITASAFAYSFSWF